MKKIISVIAILGIFYCGMAAPQTEEKAEAAQEQQVADVGNKLCPVMGGPVSGKDFVVFEGKRYGLCCSGCDRSFLADPDKYIAQIKAQEPELFSEHSSEDRSESVDTGM